MIILVLGVSIRGLILDNDNIMFAMMMTIEIVFALVAQMTRDLLTSLLILWDLLDDYSLDKAWVQIHRLATRITKKQIRTMMQRR